MLSLHFCAMYRGVKTKGLQLSLRETQRPHTDCVTQVNGWEVVTPVHTDSGEVEATYITLWSLLENTLLVILSLTVCFMTLTGKNAVK